MSLHENLLDTLSTYSQIADPTNFRISYLKLSFWIKFSSEVRRQEQNNPTLFLWRDWSSNCEIVFYLKSKTKISMLITDHSSSD